MSLNEFNPDWSDREKVEWFISFFMAIPVENWCVEEFVKGGRCCAFGHLGVLESFGNINVVAIAFTVLFRGYLKVVPHQINDNTDHTLSAIGKLPNPKARILKALTAILDMIDGKEVDLGAIKERTKGEKWAIWNEKERIMKEVRGEI